MKAVLVVLSIIASSLVIGVIGGFAGHYLLNADTFVFATRTFIIVFIVEGLFCGFSALKNRR